MMRFTATVFCPYGPASTQKGDTKEEAIKKAMDCHSSFRGLEKKTVHDPTTGLITLNPPTPWEVKTGTCRDIKIGVVYENVQHAAIAKRC